jgi:hypothetical protein
MGSLPVTSTPAPVSNTFTAAISGQNIGNSNVYFGANTAVSSNSYDAVVQPGQSFTIPASTSVYAVTASGQAGSLVWSQAVGTQGVTGVTVSGTVTVANPVTNPTVSGTVAAQVGNTPVLLASATVAVPAAVGNTVVYSSTGLDVSVYASVFVVIQTTASVIYAPVAANYIDCFATQKDAIAGGFSNTADRAQWLVVPGSTSQTLQVAVANQYFAPTITAKITAAMAAGSSATVKIYGSYETVGQSRYVSLPGGSLGGSAGAPSGTVPTLTASGTTATGFFETCNGNATLLLSEIGVSTTSVGLAELGMCDAGVVTTFATLRLQAGPGQDISIGQPLQLPMRPIQLKVVGAVTASVYLASLTQ